jgi:O2-independent ubiquinone biosynthesis accessory factor UbiT
MTVAKTEEKIVDLLGVLGARLQPVVSRLPMQPPARLLCALLDRLLVPKLEREARSALTGRCAEIEVIDFGLRLRLVLDRRGLRPARPDEAPAVRIAATSGNFWRLLRGQDDADRLFFERALLMEGDTEFALILKNTLDAIGPLWT